MQSAMILKGKMLYKCNVIHVFKNTSHLLVYFFPGRVAMRITHYVLFFLHLRRFVLQFPAQLHLMNPCPCPVLVALAASRIDTVTVRNFRDTF